MSTSTVVREHLSLPPVGKLVDSFKESASVALAKFDRQAANDSANEAPVAHSPVQSAWMSELSSPPKSRLGKGGTFAIVVLVHVLIIYALSFFKPTFKEEPRALLQVVTIDAPQSAKETPPPPVPVQPRMPDLNLPIEPVIDIAVVDSNSITVAPRPVEQASEAAAASGAPKLVSSVEYVREPVAKYPPAARTLKQRGTVMLRALIDTTGHASEVNVHRSSGFRLLDDTARTAVMNALFKPYTENGRSIPVYVFIPIEFGAST